MREFECQPHAGCRDLCRALGAQGVKVLDSLSGECELPSLLNESKNGEAVVLHEEPRNVVLVAELVGAVRDLLEQDESIAEVLASAIDSQQSVLDTRMKLWNTMITARKMNRAFTDIEYRYFHNRVLEAEEAKETAFSHIPPELLVRAQAAFDKETLEKTGLVFDEQSIAVLNVLAGNYLDGKPTLLVGDKGIAKTQLARFMGSLASDGDDPIFISGKGDQMSDEFMGRYIQDSETGNFVFKEGKAVEAMRQGKPLIIDEINLADQAITMRLQDILLRKPGDSIALTEDGNKTIQIQPGFVVFATANEASERYKHRVTLDPAFRDRFEVVRLNYPDSENERPLEEVPITLMRLALAAVSDNSGRPSAHIDLQYLEEFVKVAHITQQLYSKPLQDSGAASLAENQSTTTTFLINDKPVMSDCITPRTMIDTLRRCADGNKPDVSLEKKVASLIDTLDQAGATDNAIWAKRAQELLTRKNLS